MSVNSQFAGANEYLRKSLPPISRLPQELFNEVLEIILAEADDSHDLLPYTHVSRRWRHFAISSPILWTKYLIYNQPRIYPELLRWTGPNVLISVTLSLSKFSSSTAEFISTYLPRLKELDVEIDSRMSPVILESITPLAPSLQSLRIQYYGQNSQADSILPRVFRAGLPKLRRLELWGITVPWDSFSFDTITELQMDTRIPASALRKMTQLRILRLAHCLTPGPSLQVGSSADPSVVELQSLKELEVADASLLDISFFLSQLRIPVSAQLTIAVHSQNAFGSEMAISPPSFCQPDKHLRVAWDNPYQILFTRKFLTMRIFIPQFVRTGVVLRSCLAALAATSALESLALRMNSSIVVTRSDWFILLSPMVHLTRLELLFEFSSRLLLLNLASDPSLPSKVSSTPLLPSLTEVVLVIEEGSVSDFDPLYTLIRFLQGRAALGVRVSSLTVFVKHADSFEATDKEMEGIEALVDTLHWEIHRSD
jgi:hypothetical protein